MSKIVISWRDVFDAKIAGDQIDTTLYKAKDAGYKMFCHNGRIFTITSNSYIQIAKVEEI